MATSTYTKAQQATRAAAQAEADRQAAQRKAEHEHNLDCAQREIDRRSAEGEAMSLAVVDPKTYAIVFNLPGIDVLKRARLLQLVQNRIESAQFAVERHVLELTKRLNEEYGDVNSEMESARNAAEAAARISVYRSLKHALTGSENALHADVLSRFKADLLGKARYPSFSTCPTTNLQHTYTVAALAQAIDTLAVYTY